MWAPKVQLEISKTIGRAYTAELCTMINGGNILFCEAVMILTTTNIILIDNVLEFMIMCVG